MKQLIHYTPGTAIRAQSLARALRLDAPLPTRKGTFSLLPMSPPCFGYDMENVPVGDHLLRIDRARLTYINSEYSYYLQIRSRGTAKETLDWRFDFDAWHCRNVAAVREKISRANPDASEETLREVCDVGFRESELLALGHAAGLQELDCLNVLIGRIFVYRVGPQGA